MTVRLLAAPAELREALGLVYDCYTRRGLLKPNPLCLRVREDVELTERLSLWGAFSDGTLVATLGVIQGSLPVAALVVTEPGAMELTDFASTRRAAVKLLFAAVLEWWAQVGDAPGYAQVSPKDVALYGRLGFSCVRGPVVVGGDVVMVMRATLGTYRWPERELSER